MNFAEEYANRKEACERSLRSFAATLTDYPAVLRQAVLYSLQSGGKRLRSILFNEGVRMFGGDVCHAAVVPFAVAVECIHTYSLIHDDLPCMDNDDFRRGQPTSHKKFGEANALLAGDALLNVAYECVLQGIYEGKDEKYVRAGRMLASAAGGLGMIGGQVYDLMPQEDSRIDEIYNKKTGALITAAICAGACIGGATQAQTERVRTFGNLFGYAFQLRDDLLDAQTESADKNTYLHAFGEQCTQRALREKTDEALRVLRSLPECEFLTLLTERFMLRTE